MKLFRISHLPLKKNIKKTFEIIVLGRGVSIRSTGATFFSKSNLGNKNEELDIRDFNHP